MDIVIVTLYSKGLQWKDGNIRANNTRKAGVEVCPYWGVGTEVLDLGAWGAGGYPPTGGGLV
jgi:hypothetical protein